MGTLIELEQMHFAWPNQPRLLEIEAFQLQEGERVFLRGPSGSGKSTLLGLLSGVHLPQSGCVRLLGRNWNTLSSAARDQFRADHIGYIFQQFNLLPFLSVLENVLLPCRFSDSRARRATARHTGVELAAHYLLNRLGLSEDLWQRRADSLSIGQQQRVAAARALIGQPELIIADEPTSALDADTREVFLNLLFTECAVTGAGLLFVSHDQSLAHLFDRSFALSELNQVCLA